MQFGDCLPNEGFCRGGGGGLSHFFEDVEGGLVALAALIVVSIVCEGGGRREGETYKAQANPGFGNVDEEAILCPFSSCLNFFEGEIGAVLLEVDLYD